MDGLQELSYTIIENQSQLCVQRLQCADDRFLGTENSIQLTGRFETKSGWNKGCYRRRYTYVYSWDIRDFAKGEVSTIGITNQLPQETTISRN